jgi:hypothetical protein
MADIYLDSCCFIYLVEGEPQWRAVVEQRLRDLESTSRLVTSQLARLECRTKPTRDGNRALLERYDMLFGADRVAVLDGRPCHRSGDGLARSARIQDAGRNSLGDRR